MTDRQTMLQPVPGDGDEPSGRWRRLRGLRPGHGPSDAGVTGQTDGTGSEATDDPFRATRTQSRWTVVGFALTGVGVMAALFLVYIFAFTPLTHSRGQHELLQSAVDNHRAANRLTGGTIPPEGSPVGILTIPAIGVQQAVISGTSAADLEKGPGLMAGTAVPGAPGNAVIAGRRVTFGGPFASLARLAPGDRLTVLDGLGSYRFRVVSVTTVGSGASEPPPVPGHSWLTLVTSEAGMASGGHVVVLSRIIGLPAQTPRVGSTPPGDPSVPLGFPGEPAALGLAFVWFLVFLAGLGLTVGLLRRWRQPVVIYMFSAPVLLACGLFACENLARCLPATL